MKLGFRKHVVLAVLLVAPSAAADVEIIRDEWGVPHIYAETEAEGFYGLGYAQAEDRLENLLGMIEWSKGRAASLMGASMLQSDMSMRKWQHEKEGIQGVVNLSPALKQNYEYFVRGLQAYMEDHPSEVPSWAARDIGVADMLTLVRALFWGTYQTAEGMKECMKKVPADAFFTEASHPQGASNEWAVAPERTENGAVILLADPHAGVDNPAYYEYHMQAGELHSAGYSAGPMLWQSHNENLGWALTTGAPDVVDCYEITLDPHDPDRYRFDGEWRQIEKQTNTIQVAGSEPVQFVVEYTSFNDVFSPIVARTDGKAYALTSAYMHYAGVMHEEFYRMNKAASMADLKVAISTTGMLPENLLVGDVEGNIYFARIGRTPIRNKSYDWAKPVSGNTSATAWNGFHKLSDLIQFDNPKQGYIQNNNVAADRMFANANFIQRSNYPEYIFNDKPGRMTSRGVRSNEVLSAAANFTFDDAVQLANDEKWTTTGAWQRALRYAVSEKAAEYEVKSSHFKEYTQHLLAFDGFASADSAIAAKFYFWRKNMAAGLSAPLFTQFHSFPWRDAEFTPEFADVLFDKIDTAIATMRALYGTTDIKLGDIFRVGPKGHDLPVGGVTITSDGVDNCRGRYTPFCDVTLRAFRIAPIGSSGMWRATGGTQGMRLLEFGQPVKSMSMRLYGQSKNPKSKHFSDQVALSSNKQLKPNYFSRSDVLAHAVSRKTLLIKAAKVSLNKG